MLHSIGENMLKVNSYVYSNNMNFAGGNAAPQEQISASSVSKDSKVQKYPKTHAGLCLGVFAAGGAVLTEGLIHKIKGATESSCKKTMSPLLFIPISIATLIGCGLVTDKIINDKNSQFIQKTKDMTPTQATASEKRAELTRKGNPYYKSGTGKLIGIIGGTVITPILGLLHSKGKINYLRLIEMAAGAIGGLSLGAISDHYANKNARNYADKQNALIHTA